MSESARPAAWIRSPAFDGAWILLPPLLVALAALLAPAAFAGELPTAGFLLLVVAIDAGHVYATLFRTYLDPATRRERPFLLWGLPALCWAGGTALFAAGGALLFWRLLAYVAVFHFVRQAYGFMMLYARHEPEGPDKWLDRAAIYAATLHPLLWWHGHLPRRFRWFVADDFLPLAPPVLVAAAGALAVGVYVLYAANALRRWRRGERNVAKHMWLAGTALAWHAGIVWRDSDALFTLTNVVAHGVPYFALVGAWRRRPGAALTAWDWAPLLVVVPVVIAWCEESLWDRWIWLDHPGLFAWRGPSSPVSNVMQSWLIPLLAVPQASHYLQDAFLWRLSARRDPLVLAPPVAAGATA